MIILREYQKEAIEALWSALQKGNNALLDAPCAFGKSITLASVINIFLKCLVGGRVLVIVDREILVRQLQKTIFDVTGIKAGIICASVSTKKEYDKQVTIATRQTLINNIGKLPAVQLLIADEVHLLPLKRDGYPASDQYGKIIEKLLEYNERMRILGVTATPYSLTAGYIYGNRNKEGLLPYFAKTTHSVTYNELITDGYLCPLKGKVFNSGIDLSKVGMVAGEYNLGQLSLECQRHVSTINDAIEQHAKLHEHIIIFCVDIAHVEAVVNAVPYSVAYHSKQTPIEHQIAMEGYRNGTYRCIVSVSQLSVGFDHPPTSCAIMARPTKSVSLFIQCVGRVMRPFENKEECLLIDLTTNSKDHLARFDLDKPIVNIPRISGEGEAPFKLCPAEDEDGFQCMEQVHPKCQICPECGYKWEKEIAEHLKKMDLVAFESQPPDPPEWYNVTQMKVVNHKSKKSGFNLLRVILTLDVLTRIDTVSEWICCSSDYSSFAVKKGKEKWLQYLEDEMPDDVDTALWIFEEGAVMPEKVKCTTTDKGFYNIVEYPVETDIEYPELEPLIPTGEAIPF